MNTILARILSTAILISIIISTTEACTLQPKTIKYNYDWCDKIWGASFFSEVVGEFKECKSRFTWNTNRIKREFYLNSYGK